MFPVPTPSCCLHADRASGYQDEKPPEPKISIKPTISVITDSTNTIFCDSRGSLIAPHKPPKSIMLFEAVGKRPKPSEETERWKVMIRKLLTINGSERL